MNDLKTLVDHPECCWGYIDELRMALAATCKERDESRKQLHEAKSELDELRKTFDMYGGYDGIQNAFAERDAAVEDLRKLAHEHCTCYACVNDKFDYDKSVCTGCPYNNWNNWQWRGIPKEEY